MLEPKNTTKEISDLAGNFKKNLTEIFKHYTPLVIGYGGNDGSLMSFLEDLPEIKEGIFWFYRKDDNGLSDRTKDLIEKFNGFAVVTPDFDETMMQISGKLGFKLLDNRITEVAKQRKEKYLEQIFKIFKWDKTTPETKILLIIWLQKRIGCIMKLKRQRKMI